MGRGKNEATAKTAGRRSHNITIRLVDSLGADDYESDEGQAVILTLDEKGELRANVCDDYLRIRWIEVAEEVRGQGLARALLEHLQKLYPGRALTTGGFTDEGAQALGHLITEEPDPAL